MSRTASSRKSDPLSKKIPENPKYKHIKSTIDTGASLSKYLEHVDEIRKNYRYRKDEIFKRLKVTTFAQLVLQVAGSEDASSVVELYSSDFDDSISPVNSPTHTSMESPPGTARSTLSSIVAGVGELDVGMPEAASPPPPPTPSLCPYLLLDVRDKEDYDRCHVISAKSYPATMLSRSCNYFTRDILEYIHCILSTEKYCCVCKNQVKVTRLSNHSYKKNKPGRIIILYDEDERIAPQAATTFVQREVDNVFMLSGGLKVAYKTFPEGMISGPVPVSCIQSPPGSARKKTSSTQLPLGQGARISAASTAGRNKFTSGDLHLLQNNLDEALTSSRASSRATTSASIRTTTSASSRATSRSESRAVSTRPWK